jgi:hypothetical protein
MNAAPPFAPVSQGNRHILPRPTALPAAARMAPRRVAKLARLFIFCYCVVMDIIWFCHDKRFVFKGTEDMIDEYHNYFFHIKGSLIGEVIGIVVCLIAALIVSFI